MRTAIYTLDWRRRILGSAWIATAITRLDSFMGLWFPQGLCSEVPRAQCVLSPKIADSWRFPFETNPKGYPHKDTPVFSPSLDAEPSQMPSLLRILSAFEGNLPSSSDTKSFHHSLCNSVSRTLKKWGFTQFMGSLTHV